MPVGVKLLKSYEEVVIDGKPIKVRRIISITPTHIIVEHIDGKVEAIPLDRVSSEHPRGVVLV